MPIFSFRYTYFDHLAAKYLRFEVSCATQVGVNLIRDNDIIEMTVMDNGPSTVYFARVFNHQGIGVGVSNNGIINTPGVTDLYSPFHCIQDILAGSIFATVQYGVTNYIRLIEWSVVNHSTN